MARVTRWALLSSASAPALLIGGWLASAALQPGGYDPATQTISALAAHGATDRWVMTSALIGLGVCHLITALGLRVVAPAGRVVLACGGAATVLVGLLPEPNGGTSISHMAATGAGFTALSVWPCLAARRDRIVPWVLTPPLSLTVTMTMAAGGACFLLELHAHGPAGAAERALTATQAFWPLVVAFCLWLRPWPWIAQTMTAAAEAAGAVGAAGSAAMRTATASRATATETRMD